MSMFVGRGWFYLDQEFSLALALWIGYNALYYTHLVRVSKKTN